MANARLGSQHYGIPISQCTPTFILKADDTYIALIIQGSRKIDFKAVEAFLGVKKATMASKDEIHHLTGSPIGSVSMINPNIRTLIDRGVQTLSYAYGGCGVENHTLKIKASNLLQVSHGEVGEFSRARN